MGIRTALDTVLNEIINSNAWFDSNNASIGDERVFTYVETDPGSNDKCVMVEYDGFERAALPTEFGSSTITWRIAVNGFFRLNDADYNPVMDDARKFVDDMISMVSTAAGSPTLDGSSMATAVVLGGSPPLVYRRANHTYVLVSVSIGMMDNIS